ncbi:MAG: DUF748 domain-containing protein [Proteobacteria bacterium]|nr:DUF748 domain-containing protein [Pseudomonadota bacterium]
MAWGVVAWLALCALAWAALPPLLRWQGESRLTEALGRKVTIGEVRFLPWSLDLTIRDVSVAGAPQAAASAPASAASAAPLLQIGRIHVNASTSSIVRRAPVIEALDVDGLRARVTRTEAGHYDVDDLIARFAAQPASAPAAREPARYALYNVQLHDARLRFDDRPAQRVHELADLRLDLPFVSNLPAEVAVKVQPRLAFTLNGAHFDSGAQTTPFAPDRLSDLKLGITDLDLAPYAGYLPATLPFRITSGQVASDLALHFMVDPKGTASLAIRGTLGMRDVATTDAAGAPLLAWQRLQLELRDVQPLVRRLDFGALQLDGAELHAARDADGRISLAALAGNGAGDGPPAAAPAASAASGTVPAPAAADAWQIGIDRIALDGARVLWSDAAVHPAAQLQLDGIALDLRSVHWPMTAPMPLTLAATLRSQGDAAPALGTLKVDGDVGVSAAKLKIALADGVLEGLAPYAAIAITPKLSGKLAFDGTLDWSSDAAAPRLQVAVQSARIDALRLDEAGARDRRDPALAWQQAAIGDALLDLEARRLTLGSVKLVRPAVRLARDEKGTTNVEQWVVPSAVPAAPAASAASRPWQVVLKSLALSGGDARLVDASPGRKVRLQLTKLDLALHDLALDGARTIAPAALQLTARGGSGGRDAPDGAIAWAGRFGLAPLLVEGTLRIDRLPIHAAEPYFAHALPIELRHADAGYVGRIALREGAHGVELQAAGDALLADVRIATPAGGDELLSWQTLGLKQLKVALKPPAEPQVDIEAVNVDDFYSRLVVTEQGRFNLQDVGARPADEAASAPPAAAASAPSDAASAPPSRLPFKLAIGATHLSNGRVDFSDHYIRPNYSAQLTELTGTLGTFRSDADQMATIELHGKAAGTAILAISGALDPSTNPPVMDIRAKASDLELAPLSPYAGKYAGYAIERGKLTMDVAYKIDADGRLAATNQVIVNQLTFGEQIDSPDAIKLPVRLAVALLTDRNGVIDLDLPVSGSLKDPQFSIGRLIVKVIVNLLTKVITAPFALLSGGGGGGPDLSLVAFEPGTARIAASGQEAIDKVARALADRPALRMTITGAVDPASERAAFQHAALEARLGAEKKRLAARVSEDTSAPAGEVAATLAPDERERLLKSIYKETDLPDKPRNFLGFAKGIPAEDMQRLLEQQMPVDGDRMRALALQRGVAVREALVAKGIASDRLFLAAPDVRPEGETAWTPRARLAVTMK